MKLPKSLYRYFWDVEIKKLDPKKNPQYIGERLLEFGDIDSFSWVKKTFGLKLIGEIVKKSKILSKKTAFFLSHLLKIRKEEIKCLQGDFRAKHRQIWRF